MKKMILFVTIIAFAVSCIGAACAETVDAHQLFGTVTGDVYENEYLGIGCKLDGWYYYSEEDIAAANQMARDVFSSKDIGAILNNVNVLYLMMAEFSNGMENVNIVLQHENETYMSMVDAVGVEGLLNMGGKDYYASMLEQAGYSNINIDITKISIGGAEFSGMQVSYDFMGVTACIKQVYSLYGDYMMILTVCGPSYENVDDVLSRFYILQDNRTEKTALADQQDPNTGMNGTAEAEYYYDRETGAHFMIPAGWEEKALSQEWDIIKMKMSPVNEEVVSIMFGWEDLWDALSASQRSAMGLKSRKDLDSLLNAELLSIMFGVDKDVEMRSVSGVPFGIGTVSQTAAGLTMDLKVAVTIRDGYVIMFQMPDLYEDYRAVFDAVLESVYFN